MLELATGLLNRVNQVLFPRMPIPSPPALFRAPRLKPSRLRRESVNPSHDVDASIDAAQDHLSSLQHPDGCWEGKVYDNSTITSEYLMLLRFLGILDGETARKAQKTLLDTQLSGGGWNIYGGGPNNHSATVEAYFALKLTGLSAQHPALKRARKPILENGGIETTRVFTKVSLAFFGQYPWMRIPMVQPELMLLPRKAPIHIYEFSSWSRSVIIPLLIVFDRKPVVHLPAEQQLPELGDLQKDAYKVSRRPRKPFDLEQIFRVLQSALSLYERLPLKPFRKKSLDAAEKWILERQNDDGSWCGIFPAMANGIIALHLRGYPLTHPVIVKALQGLRSYVEETETFLRMQSTKSPVWDTAIAAYALGEADVSTAYPALRKSVPWLLNEQILDVSGDWRFKALPGRPGGWPFEHKNDHYPDIDDTAFVILALLPYEEKRKILHSIERGIEWLLAMQGSDGGWGAFDRDNNRQILNDIPFADLKSLLDPSTPDVTGHVLEAFGAAGVPWNSTFVQRGVRFLREKQEEDGSWFGRWGVDYVYGTGAVLSGLEIAGENMRKAYVRKASAWLKRIQNADGGWGESCESYDRGSYVPLGYSTPSQTAWALLGLLASPFGHKEAIRRGIRYLVDAQNPDGSWDEPEWTGTGFPRYFYLRYDYYRLYFPLMALGRYRRMLHSKRKENQT